ncbi:cysteine hydrolase, partial [Cupriavidus sp. KB_39]
MNFHLPRYLRFATVGVSLAVSVGVAAAGPNPHPSIRAILGAQPIDHLEASTTALVIIDFQKEYFSGRLPIPDGRRALAQAQRLVAFAD